MKCGRGCAFCDVETVEVHWCDRVNAFFEIKL